MTSLGRVWLVARAGCFGCVTWPFGSAWGLANHAFQVRNRYLGERDEQIEKLYRWRSILGFAIIVGIEAYYHSLRSGFSHGYMSINDSVDTLVRVVLIGGALAPIGVALLTERGYRLVALRQLRFPAGAVAGYVALYFAVSRGLPFLLRPRTGANAFLVSVLALVAIIWLGVLVLRGLYLVIVGMFRLADGHPLLAPLTGTVIAWGAAVNTMVAGGSSDVPSTLAVLLLVGGPISVTAVSALEVARLRRRYPRDFPFRRGPVTGFAGRSR